MPRYDVLGRVELPVKVRWRVDQTTNVFALLKMFGYVVRGVKVARQLIDYNTCLEGTIGVSGQTLTPDEWAVLATLVEEC